MLLDRKNFLVELVIELGECKRESGVAFAVKTSIATRLEELPSGVSDRIRRM